MCELEVDRTTYLLPVPVCLRRLRRGAEMGSDARDHPHRAKESETI